MLKEADLRSNAESKGLQLFKFVVLFFILIDKALVVRHPQSADFQMADNLSADSQPVDFQSADTQLADCDRGLKVNRVDNQLADTQLADCDR